MNYRIILITLSLLNGMYSEMILPDNWVDSSNESMSLLDRSVSLLNVRPPTPIEASCLSYYSYLAKLGSTFTRCVVSYSRPFRVCENCLRYYMQITEAKSLIKNDVDLYATSLYQNGLKCQNIVEATDKVQTIVKIFQTIDTIWDQANCNDCFESSYLNNGTFNYTIKEKYEQFNTLHQNLEICIFNFTQNPISLDPLFQTYTPNATLCNTCQNEYINLSKNFKFLGKERNLCMDVVDLFNYTRITWSKGYKCSYRDIDELYVNLISGFVITLTLGFYVLVRLISRKEARPSFKCK